MRLLSRDPSASVGAAPQLGGTPAPRSRYTAAAVSTLTLALAGVGFSFMPRDASVNAGSQKSDSSSWGGAASNGQVTLDRTISLERAISGANTWFNTDKQLTPADFEGRAVLVYLWGPSCPPCLKKIPELNRIVANDPRVAVLAISTEPGDKVRRFAGSSPEEQRKFFTFVGADGGSTFRSFGVSGIPHAVIFNPDGTVAFNKVGPKIEELKSALSAAADKVPDASSLATLPMRSGSEWTNLNFAQPISAPQPPRPESLQQLSCDQFDRFVEELGSRLKDPKAKVTTSDIRRLADFFRGNTPQLGWPGDHELRKEIVSVWSGLYQRSRGTSAEAVSTRAELGELALSWVSKSDSTKASATIESDPELRAHIYYTMEFTLLVSETSEGRRALLEKMARAGVIDDSVIGGIALKKLLYRLEHGEPKRPSSLLDIPYPNDVLSAPGRAKEEGFFSRLDKSPSIDHGQLLQEVFTYTTEQLPIGTANPREERLRRVDSAVAFIAALTKDGEAEISTPLRKLAQEGLADLFVKHAGVLDWLLDHRIALRMNQLGFDQLEAKRRQELESTVERRMSELGKDRGELWWTLELTKAELESINLAFGHGSEFGSAGSSK